MDGGEIGQRPAPRVSGVTDLLGSSRMRRNDTMTSFDVDRRIEALARRQHGVFNRTQALQAGASSSLIDRRLASGAWVLLDHSVYALRSHPFSFLRQCWAATLSMPGAVVAGSTAAAIWGFTGYRPGGIEIAVTPTISARSRIATVHRLSGALVTTMAQTLFDVARPSSMVRLERALDDLLAARRITLEPLEERLAFYEATRR